MIRSKSAQFAAATIVGLSAVGTAPLATAQQPSTSAGSSGARPRTTDERVTTENATPPPVNSDYRRAAEGTLPIVPGTAGTVGGGAIDPAARPLVGSPAANGAPNLGTAAAPPAGVDAALMIEHALDMAIDGSALMALAMANKPDDAGNDSVKALKAHAQDELRESKDLLTKAAAVGNQLDAASPVRRFYAAASNYMKALDTATTPGTFESPNDKAEIAGINHAIKAVMDGNRLSMMGTGVAPSPALEPLLAHGRMMKDEGMKALDRMAGTAPVDPNSPPSTQSLAQRGRELINTVGQLGPVGPAMMGYGGGGNLGGGFGGQPNLPNGPVPARLQDTRPEIVGGTYGTGSPSVGTATGVEAARNVRPGTKEGPNGELIEPTPTGKPGSGVSSYGVGNNNTPPTNSSAGSRPR